MTAIKSQGVTFGRSTDGGSVYNDVGEITSIAGPGGSAAVIDVTNLSSAAKEKLIGLPDEGQITLEVNLDPGDAQQIGLKDDRASQTKRDFKITLTDTSSTELTFQAFCLGFVINAAIDDKVGATITLEVTGS